MSFSKGSTSSSVSSKSCLSGRSVGKERARRKAYDIRIALGQYRNLFRNSGIPELNRPSFRKTSGHRAPEPPNHGR